MLIILIFCQVPAIFAIALCLLLSCYGAGFSVIPAYLGDVFGTKELGAIHGYVLTAWAVAGMVGPVLLSVTHQVLHNYYVTLLAFIVIDVIAMLVEPDVTDSKGYDGTLYQYGVVDYDKETLNFPLYRYIGDNPRNLSSFPFNDVSDNAWYYEAVNYAYQNNLFNGTSATTFGPDVP